LLAITGAPGLAWTYRLAQLAQGLESIDSQATFSGWLLQGGLQPVTPLSAGRLQPVRQGRSAYSSCASSFQYARAHHNPGHPESIGRDYSRSSQCCQVGL